MATFLVAAHMTAETAAPAAGPSLREVGRIELPGIEGRIDHLAIDLEGQRLFVAALGADEVEIVDLKTSQRIARLKDVGEPQGLVYLPASQRLFVAAGKSGEVIGFEGDRQTAAVRGLADADGLRLFGPTTRLYAGYGSGMAVIDPVSLAIVDRFALPGHPEAFELAEHGPEIFINVPTAGRIVVVDRRSGKTIAAWGIAPASSNFPMALDEAGHRLFVGTRAPARLLAYDTSSGRRVADVPLCGDVDDLFFDAERRRLFAICGAGQVDVVPLDASGRPEAAIRVATASGARTGLFVPTLRTLFVAAPARGGHPAKVLVYRTG